MSQSNTRTGDIPLPSNEDLTGMEGRLVCIVNDSNVAEAALPDAVSDLALFVLVDGGSESGDICALRPLSPDRNVRLTLHGTAVPGDVIVLDAIDGTHDGQVRKLPATGGTYRGLGIAEEAGVDGQLLLVRPALIGNITVAQA